ncbi:hypothetical protein MNBD_GAMMA08-437 [hydrothermal vent metagenome]|uniref:Response regulatory domain-containing protein n=1 Tax=hydrothermal vent metagenome TaxID=652676 RepID=A0A3B0XXG2_9ZZZZ
MANTQKDYYSSRQAAEILGVAVSTIQLWTNNGLLQAWTTVGGHRRIACTSVEEMQKQNQQDSGLESPDELTVVVVDDNEQQLRLYEKQIKSWDINCELITAENGYEGLIKIGSHKPDIIISDLLMPRMDGFQMVRALRSMQELQNSLIIVISGLSDDEIIARGSLPDDITVFSKPVDFDKLKLLFQKKYQAI